MSTCSLIARLASYNQLMNDRLYGAAANLTPQEWMEDRKAFFGSLCGTLNHILVADIIWLKRFSLHPAHHAALDPVRQLSAPQSLDWILYSDLEALSERRKMLDAVIQQWADALTEADLEHILHYSDTKGVKAAKRFSDLALHFFNHQTHHRGQATTLLSQADVEVGITDLLQLIPDESAA
jgi:uncharacterized damage-inducible protein DinB